MDSELERAKAVAVDLGRPSAAPGEGLLLRVGTAAAVLIGLCILVYAVPAARTPTTHTILDSCIFLTSAMLALVSWDLGRRSDDPLIRPLAIAFSIVASVELYHTLMAIESSIDPDDINPDVVRRLTGSWAPSSYLLPLSLIGITLSERLRRQGWLLALVMIAAAALMIVVFNILPRFSTPGVLGVTRPTLVLVPFLWFAAGWLSHNRISTPVGQAIAGVSLIAVPTFAIMCYSATPYDAAALVGHLGKLIGRIFLLFSILQYAARDISRRAELEAALRELAENLEKRVRERTASLTEEIASRTQAEERTQTQLARLNLLHEITAAIGQRHDLDSIFQATVRSIESQFSAELVLIGLCEPGSPRVTVNNVGKSSQDIARRVELMPGGTIDMVMSAQARLASGEIIYEPNLPSWPGPFAQKLSGEGLHSGLIAPLVFDDRLFAVLLVARSERAAFSSSDCGFLRMLAVHVALAAQQAGLYSDLHKAYDHLRQSQQSMMQQERLSALGQMASGIAHDINNALSPLALTTQALIRSEPNLAPRVREYLETVKRVTNDIAATVARMREFYRQQDESPLEPVDLNELAQQTVDLTRARWSDMPQERGIVIGLRSAYGANLPKASGAAGEIREALTNLIFNAVDAMPKGGGITVRTGTMEDEGKVFVEVADTGVGMDEETRQRCLEPFFTTKGERGTGLGLAMVFGAMQRQKGTIAIDSAPGKGTAVRLIFHMAKDAPPAPKVEVAAAGALKLLVVDDDPFVLDSMQIVLEIDGHEVAIADGGHAALAALEEAQAKGAPFDIVFTDLGMPGMDGRAVAKEIKARSPGTPVVLLTGWGKHIGEQSIGHGVDYALSKPPSQETLLEALAHCIGLKAKSAVS